MMEGFFFAQRELNFTISLQRRIFFSFWQTPWQEEVEI